ncbi:polyprenyl synthetase family protein, partial [Escherichia coli]|uniref:polyprenyl synthetase family protein n=1 Tax=Escherichia coli TaxID=562 RepID=UPI003F76CA09
MLQLSKVRDASTTEETYMEVIRGKTAMLFEASTHSAAALCGATAEQAEARQAARAAEGAKIQQRKGDPGHRAAEQLGQGHGAEQAVGQHRQRVRQCAGLREGLGGLQAQGLAEAQAE